ncbi:bifunctional phosphoribosylaminoimidazolecarboxamide formyltransferase/IMP cyclohydrolase, partial [Pseudomonas syringae pv. tagetis]
AIVERQFVEVLIAPSVRAEARAIVARKANMRLLTRGQRSERLPAWEYKRVNGGVLVQSRDVGIITSAAQKVVTRSATTENEMQPL